MKLLTNEMLFKDAITATAQQISIPEVYIEKDYWITLTLKTIFSSDNTKEYYISRLVRQTKSLKQSDIE